MSFHQKSRATCVALLMASLAHVSLAEDPAVPIGLQAELTAKIVGYDRNYSARAAGKGKILFLLKADDVGSTKVANQAKSAFASLADVGGAPHEESSMAYASAKALADEVVKQKIAIVYVSSGLSGEMAGIAEALNGKDVLTVAAVASDVARGAVLGFDLVSGKPKLLVHLTQAKKQNAAFRAEALKLMKVYE